MIRLTLIILFLSTILSCSTNSDSSLLVAVNEFVSAADLQDDGTLESRTHKDFRVVWNGPGPEDHTIFSRETYLEKFRIREWGGDPRSIEILDTEICNNYASVHVRLKGNVQDFESLYTMVREKGQWKILQESVRVSDKG